MLYEPKIYCKYKKRANSVVLVAVKQDSGTVAIFYRTAHSVVPSKTFIDDYQVVTEPTGGLSYTPATMKVTPINATPKPSKPINPEKK